jgi:acetylornithine/succinyldiaminopimelate/putrescine aminotransferase
MQFKISPRIANVSKKRMHSLNFVKSYLHARNTEDLRGSVSCIEAPICIAFAHSGAENFERLIKVEYKTHNDFPKQRLFLLRELLAG